MELSLEVMWITTMLKYDTQCLVNIMHITLNNYKKFGKEWNLYCNHKRFVK